MIYIASLHNRLRQDVEWARVLGYLVLVGGVLFVACRHSLAAVAAGLLVMKSAVLPRWLGWISILAGLMFFLQGFGLGGVIATFGLVFDLIAFVLFLVFVLASSVVLVRRGDGVGNAQPARTG